jgi:hypothetical protein
LEVLESRQQQRQWYRRMQQPQQQQQKKKNARANEPPSQMTLNEHSPANERAIKMKNSSLERIQRALLYFLRMYVNLIFNTSH